MAELVSVEPSSTRMSSNERKFCAKTLSIASAMKASPLKKMVMTETLHTIEFELYKYLTNIMGKITPSISPQRIRHSTTWRVGGLLGSRGHALVAPNLTSSTFACQSPTAIRERSCKSARKGSIVASHVEHAHW